LRLAWHDRSGTNLLELVLDGGLPESQREDETADSRPVKNAGWRRT
jgi:hypothetical protein